MTSLTQLPAFQALQNHFAEMKDFDMKKSFAEDKNRFQNFSLSANGIFLDFSKNRITPKTLSLLADLARESQLEQKIQALFSGEKINFTENRSVLHTALRRGENAPAEVQQTLAKMREFSDRIRAGKWLGATGKPITDIVNVGIGGSNLGPFLTTQALAQFAKTSLHCHFISNVDHSHAEKVLSQLNPETTLFIISSKSFTTIETLTHAKFIFSWLKKSLGENISQHITAVTANAAKAKEFGIPENQIFSIWDWVGGRYSIWSAIGLPLAILIGMDQFSEFLKGAHAMDEHFQKASFNQNLPVILALLGIWYNNFFKINQHAVLPYADELSLFPAYLQQLDMESNGKAVSLDGNNVPYHTGPVIFGEQGCNAQHSFYQWLHQSPQFIPLDFILIGKKDDLLIGSALSQAQAFMQGKSFAKLKENNEETIAKHKTISGNRPSNVIFLDKLDPFHLGALLALYEHKVFVQGIIWQINSFDQWGVELGKELLPPILAALNSKNTNDSHDDSTKGLIAHYQKLTGHR